MVSDKVSFYLIHNHRSKQALLELVDDWKGILVGDSYTVFFLRKRYVDLRFSTYIIVNSNIFYYFRGGILSNSYGARRPD